MRWLHTPGPWKVINDKRWGLGVDAAKNPHGDRFSFSIVEMGHVGGDHRGKDATGGTPEANARLIAAAPELLEALDRLLNVDPENMLDLVTAEERARAAIAKAVTP